MNGLKGVVVFALNTYVDLAGCIPISVTSHYSEIKIIKSIGISCTKISKITEKKS